MAKAPHRPASGGDDGSYFIEFHQIGNSVKVSAVDPVSGIEASIVGPAGESEVNLTRLAVQKLRYVLAKRGESGS